MAEVGRKNSVGKKKEGKSDFSKPAPEPYRDGKVMRQSGCRLIFVIVLSSPLALNLCCICDKNNNMKTAIVHARIEPETKAKAESVFRRLGITPTEAIRIFYTQISLRDGLPFPVEIPNEITEKTITKSRRGEEITKFGSLDEMFQSWET